MVETTTKNYGWVKPEIQHSPATWGGFLNTDLDSIDALIFANQQGIVPIGSVTMFAGAAAPANWLLCNGAVYNNTSIPLLAPVLANAYNAGTAAVAGTSTAVPNLNGRFPIGAYAGGNALGGYGGTVASSFAYSIGVPNLPAHAHPASQAAHTHPGSYQDVHTHATSQDAHAHTVGNTSAHSHVIVTGNHSHGIATGGHSHSLSAQVLTPTGGGNAGAAAGWAFTSVTTSVAGNLGGNTDTAGNLGGYTDTQALAVGNTDVRQPVVYCDNRQPAIHIDTQTPAVTVGNTGSNTPLTVMPPLIGLNFIIRYQ